MTVLIAVNELGDRISARVAQKKDDPFFCPSCKGVVVLKKGRIKIPHYAHKPPACDFGIGETEAHRQAKEALCVAINALGSAIVKHCEIEHFTASGQRADIFFRAVTNGGRVDVAIELQRSNLTPDDIRRRTEGYYRDGYVVLWLVVGDMPTDNKEIRPPAWAKYLHALYFGRIFYYAGGRIAVPFGFEAVDRYYEEVYSPDHDDYVGGYTRRLKQVKRAKRLHSVGVDIVLSMAKRKRTAWKDLPEALLWDMREKV